MPEYARLRVQTSTMANPVPGSTASSITTVTLKGGKYKLAMQLTAKPVAGNNVRNIVVVAQTNARLHTNNLILQ
jgi:hypothetical protein